MSNSAMREAAGSGLGQRATAALAGMFRGQLVQPEGPGYDDARAVWNGMIDRRPALIARCAGVADVIAAVNVAREHELTVAVRGGGHNVSGNSVCDGGLVIDLSAMRAVRVDPTRHRVRAEGGVTIGDLDRETQAFGLAVPQGLVSETGIAGLTLGGGLGWLRRKHGLSCDNLISADVITADGRLVIANEAENPELLWGLRGGGGNFGIVTSLEFQAHPVGPDVYVVMTFHPRSQAEAALHFYREWEATCPDEASSLAIMWHAPAIDEIPTAYHHQPVVVHMVVYAGDPAEGGEVLRPLREFGNPIADLSDTMPYVAAQRLLDEDYPAHVGRYYWKSLFLAELGDDALHTVLDLNDASPSPESTLDLWELGGAFGRVGAGETAFGDRSASFMLGIEANWRDPAADEENIAWARKVHQTMQQFSTGAEYFNFPGFFEDAEQTVRTTFAANYQRLAALKATYDPTNLFRLNQNIPPA